MNGSHMFNLKPTDETFYNLNPLLCNSLMMAGWGGGGLWTNSLDLEHEIQKKIKNKVFVVILLLLMKKK